MKPPIRKTTIILRLWTDGDQVDDHDWRGTAEIIGGSQSFQFQSLDDFIKWLRRELAKIKK